MTEKSSAPRVIAYISGVVGFLAAVFAIIFGLWWLLGRPTQVSGFADSLFATTLIFVGAGLIYGSYGLMKEVDEKREIGTRWLGLIAALSFILLFLGFGEVGAWVAFFLGISASVVGFIGQGYVESSQRKPPRRPKLAPAKPAIEKYCPHCKLKLPADAEFCPECGRKVKKSK